MNTSQTIEARKAGKKDFPGAPVAIGVHEVVRINDNLMEGNGIPEEHSMPQVSSPTTFGKRYIYFH